MIRYIPAILNGVISSAVAIAVGYHADNWQWWAIVTVGLASYTLGLIAAELRNNIGNVHT
jgi:hypothetical protein